jgi:hypothetical protein
MCTKQLAVATCIVVAVALDSVLLPFTLEPAAAQSERRAALIAQFGDGSYVTRCVSFSQESITGLELLVRSGLEVSLWGGAVCRIEQEGCDYPTQACFCQCKGSSCQYWSYWHLRDGNWTYAQVGSGDYRVGDGDFEAWLWGDAQTPPVAVPFAEICGPSDTSTTEDIPGETAIGSTQKSSSQSIPLAQYAVFAVMAVGLAAGFWFVRGRQRG